MEERRKFQRFTKMVKVAFTSDEPENRSGTVSDISLGGMYINTRQPEVPGRTITASLDAEDLGKIISVRGRVVRHTETGMAILFTGSQPKDMELLLS